MIVALSIPGTPVPQGSKNVTRTGRMYEANKALPAWRKRAVAALAKEYAATVPLDGPLRVDATFYMPRPKRHYGTGRNSDRLKPGAPDWHTYKPDTDKLQRAVGDALTIARVIRDDSLICEWHTRKVYGQHPHTLITIHQLT